LVNGEKYEKQITRLSKSGNNLFIKLKANIKLGQLEAAFKVFEE
jgi:hypothetical protein